MKRVVFPIFAILLFSCNKQTTGPLIKGEEYAIGGTKIFVSSNPAQLIGANALHSFAAGSYDMNAWNMDIAREFVGNMKENPLSGAVIRDANGAFLHALLAVADSNRSNKRITIICPFGWDGTSATMCTGKRPSLVPWWSAFKTKLRDWAIQFKNRPDVWIELWNEPYRFDRADGYTDDIWLTDMTELLNIIRSAGNSNIVLVPCAEQGQDESVLINKGNTLQAGQKNILFDVHAYEKWLLVPNAVMGSRLQQLKDKNIPVIFGEVAPLNAGVLMNPQPFLDSVYNRGLSVCAWVWKYDGTDTDALLTAAGLPNNNSNNNWGSLYQGLCLKPRKP
jgi:mannan endo-1,4-beta-mannosidase